jgi:hypothetical protein
VDKSGDILQETFKHYFEMAMDHHTKAGTTSSILLIAIGAIIGLVGLDNVIGGVAVLLIGLFGTIWTWKQHERYHYWQHIAYEYQKELSKIVPELKTAEVGGDYDRAAQADAAKAFGHFFAKKVHDKYLWVSLHSIVALIGIVIIVVSVLGR